jgi:3-deoxy-D-manno-octulosonic-acid transferase
VQNEESLQLLHSIGVNQCQVVGDTRFDSVLETKNLFLNQIKKGHLDEDWIKFETFLEGKKAIIIGSSWPAEERLIIPYILKNKQLKFILAPHDISNEHITKIEQGLGDSCVRFTHFNEINNSVNCLILDTIGHLSKAYYFGEIALVGGGFSGKLHNILEPAVFGLPVLFGPNHTKFPEANLFLKNQIAFEFKDENEMENKLNLLIQENPILSSEIKNFIASQSGAALKIISSLRIGS